MKRFAVLILSVALLAGIASAQVLNPIKWKFSHTQKKDIVTLKFTATLENGWHVYSHYIEPGGPIPTSLIIDDSNEGQYELLGKWQESPAPHKEFDKNFGIELAFFNNTVTFTQKLKILSPNDFTLKGFVEYMMCNDETCLPPTEYDFEISVKGVSAETEKPKENNTPSAKENETTPETTQPDTPVTQQDTTVTDTETVSQTKTSTDTTTTQTDITTTASDNTTEGHSSLWWFFFVSFLSGLLGIVTPCVFPMIPMTVSFFMHDGDNKAKARIEALTYSISIILIYTLIGTLVAITLGPNFANWLSTHWIPNIAFFLIFLVFAFSFFGMFEITLPSWLIEKSDKNADKGGMLGAFFMAFTLVLVSFSCTGPIVGAILVESAGGEVLKPIIGMFGFSLAFAIPFGLFAFFPQWLNKMPKSGGWLNSVKVVLGFLELALGLKFLSIADQTYHWHILDREVYLAIWIVIFTLMGFYLLGKLRFVHDSKLEHISVGRLLLSIVTFSFVVYMIPGMFGAPLKALAGYLPPETTIDFNIDRIVRNNLQVYGGVSNSNNTVPQGMCAHPKYADKLELPHGLNGYFDYKQAVECAKKQNKPVFIDFTGHGCVNCRNMEATVWADPKVLKHLRNDFVVVALYVDDKTKLPEDEWVKSTYDGKIKKTIGKKYADLQITRYNINAQPFYVLLDPNDETELVKPKSYDTNIDNFVEFLETALKNYHKKHPQQ